jgi:hypothetical protein
MTGAITNCEIRKDQLNCQKKVGPLNTNLEKTESKKLPKKKTNNPPPAPASI